MFLAIEVRDLDASEPLVRINVFGGFPCVECMDTTEEEEGENGDDREDACGDGWEERRRVEVRPERYHGVKCG